MRVLSHRGYWREIAEKNQLTALQRTFEFDFGTETDVRDLDGQLVISHDPAKNGAVLFADFLAMAQAHPHPVPLAINIKADGLAKSIKDAIEHHGIKDWFVFDMSVPDMRGHFQEGNPVFTRMSEVESSPVWLDRAAGVWLDAFEDRWYEPELLFKLLNMGKQVCVVSADLHGRAHMPHWAWLKQHDFHLHPHMMICTDHPEEARRYFEDIA